MKSLEKPFRQKIPGANMIERNATDVKTNG
jgi:hypothetical protein